MRRLPLALIAAGSLLLVGGLMLLRDDPDTSGDPGEVERALRAETGDSSTTTLLPPTSIAPFDPSPTTTTAPPPTTEDEPTPAAEQSIPLPTELRIDKIGVAAPIEPYGVDRATGQMAIPDNTTEVAWYRFGPKPGEPGSAVLAAHVDLVGAGPGVFFDLDKLEEGDRLTIVDEYGGETRYRVVARVIYQKDELPLDVVFSREGPAVVTLITCGGAFNPSIRRYDSNVVVYAVPITGDENPGRVYPVELHERPVRDDHRAKAAGPRVDSGPIGLG